MKILKDLNFVSKVIGGKQIIDEIKKEAIKWVKHYNAIANNTNEIGLSNYFRGKAYGIAEINNIIEDDLQ